MYSSQEIAERIKQQALQQGKSLATVLSECGLGKNTISKISKGTDVLTLNFAKIADSLDCSVDYLLGRDEQKETPIPKGGDGVSERARRFMSLVDGLSPSQQELLLAQLQAWNEQNRRQALVVQQSDGGKAPKSDP